MGKNFFNKRTPGKFTNTWKLSKYSSEQPINQEKKIERGIKKFLKINKSGNQHTGTCRMWQKQF